MKDIFMKDKYKTKKQLIEELEELRRRSAEPVAASGEVKGRPSDMEFIYNSISDYVTAVTTDYRIISYNRTVEKQFGAGLEGKLCYEAYQARDEVCPDCAVKRAIESGQTEYTFQPATEVSKPVEIYAFPVIDESGRIVAVVEHGRDVTEKVEMIESLRESEERFRKFFEGAPDAMFIADPVSGDILDANPEAERLTQRTHEEIVGLHQSELHPRRMDKHSRESFEEHAKQRMGHDPVENYVVRPDGIEVPVEVLAHEITMKGKTLLLGTFRDITERKKVMERLRLFSEALQEAPDAIQIVGLDGRVKFCNKSSEDIYGYSKEELTGRHISELDADPEFAESTAIPLLMKTGRWAGEIMGKNKDGRMFPVDLSISIIRDNAGEPMALVGAARDITMRKEVEKKIADSLREKEVLLKEIHHRVKNNLAIVSSLLQLQSKQVDDERLFGMLNESRNRIASMALIHDKLYQSEDLSTINLREYIDTLVNDLLVSYNADMDSFALKLDIDDGIMLSIDKMIPCGLILNELITNSLKHAFGDREEGEIRIGFKVDGSGTATLSVSDNGPGLEEDLDVSKLKTLGLILVDSLVKQLMGEIRYDSTDGMSVEITFTP
jgi:PAS domain S-box-containing protein